MTNEEIDQETQLLCDALQMCDTGEKEAETIGTLLRRVVSQAYTEAERAMCPPCARQWPVHVETHNGHNQSGRAYWHRGVLGGKTRCRATAIRDLKDSLVQETVST